MNEPRPSAPKGIAYWDYLRIDDLLSLQQGVGTGGRATSRHETLFVIVHQVFELWFKQVIEELSYVRRTMTQEPIPESEIANVVQALRRVQTIFDVGAQHWKVMETLSTRDFLDFRDRLLPASGFQSGQFREVEAILGLDESERMNFGGKGAHDRALLKADGTPSASKVRLDAQTAGGTSVRHGLDAWLHRTPIRGSVPGDPGDDDVVRAFADDYLAAIAAEMGDPDARAARQADDDAGRALIAGRYRAELASAREFLFAADVPGTPDGAARSRRARIRAAVVFIESYRELPLLAWPRELLDSLVATEQAMLIFRQRHARMVEREIGNRTGTGGSAGVAYLDQTALRYRVFRELWTVRTILLRRDAVPPLADPAFYGLRFHV